IPFMEWGYVVLLATLVQSILTSVILILIPLRFLFKGKVISGIFSFKVIAYFIGIGFGFILIEIYFIQQFTYFLSHPIYSISVVLTVILLFAGLGSLAGERFINPRKWGIKKLVWFISAIMIVYILALSTVFDIFMGTSVPLKIAISLLLIGLPSFFMGMPFPFGLKWVSRENKSFVPWAWGVNGCASVVGAVLAVIIAVNFGVDWLLGISSALYFSVGLLGVK
ncbi:MAG: SAM-dependent methyltransferase, partial [Fidelibacterota bacterium]